MCCFHFKRVEIKINFLLAQILELPPVLRFVFTSTEPSSDSLFHGSLMLPDRDLC